METVTCDKEISALLLIDPYNDFIFEDYSDEEMHSALDINTPNTPVPL